MGSNQCLVGRPWLCLTGRPGAKVSLLPSCADVSTWKLGGRKVLVVFIGTKSKAILAIVGIIIYRRHECSDSEETVVMHTINTRTGSVRLGLMSKSPGLFITRDLTKSLLISIKLFNIFILGCQCCYFLRITNTSLLLIVYLINLLVNTSYWKYVW